MKINVLRVLYVHLHVFTTCKNIHKSLLKNMRKKGCSLFIWIFSVMFGTLLKFSRWWFVVNSCWWCNHSRFKILRNISDVPQSTLHTPICYKFLEIYKNNQNTILYLQFIFLPSLFLGKCHGCCFDITDDFFFFSKEK